MATTLFDRTAIPFDGSNGAELAMQTIAPVLECAGGSLHFVMILDQYVENELAPFAEVENVTLDQAAKIACERLVAAANEAGFSATHTLATGSDVVDGLIEAADGAECTAIALPTHSFKGVTRWLMGNLRDKIVKGSSLPVLVLPPTK